jgi:hypothetical protein
MMVKKPFSAKWVLSIASIAAGDDEFVVVGEDFAAADGVEVAGENRGQGGKRGRGLLIEHEDPVGAALLVAVLGDETVVEVSIVGEPRAQDERYDDVDFEVGAFVLAQWRHYRHESSPTTITLNAAGR